MMTGRANLHQHVLRKFLGGGHVNMFYRIYVQHFYTLSICMCII